MGISTRYARQYIEPYWHEYNQKLLLAVPEGKRRGPVVAERSDHFIQLDRPDLVADERRLLLELSRVERSAADLSIGASEVQ